jgi:hypothetical protein
MRLLWAIPLLCLAEEDQSGLLQREQLLKKVTAKLDCSSGRCRPKTTTPPPNKPEILIPPKPSVKPVTTPAPFIVVPTTTLPATTTTTTPCLRLPPTELNVVANGCEKFGKKFKHVEEDCTNKDMFILRTSNIGAAFVAPTYAPDQYGTDENWMTKKVQESDWKGACVAYVKTGLIKGGTCKHFCKSNGMKCVQGMDDAHHQTGGLSKWLSTEGYKATDCTLLPGGHSRQSKADNGCNQQWGTQMCACNPVKPVVLH